ncbi:MAG: gamma-glutamylcyclotransferase [Steroidobacteraceae bacterium]|nr:gamma-glutamylcyclotransferase [Steroidobacteraceae bacterium]
MDAEILGAQGVAALSAEPCKLSGFGLRTGDRATLVPSAGSSVYGILMSVSETDLNRLYSAPGLEEYVPESVVVVDSGGALREALCYNQRNPPASDHANPEYAEKLRTLARRLGFPKHYVRSIR